MTFRGPWRVFSHRTGLLALRLRHQVSHQIGQVLGVDAVAVVLLHQADPARAVVRRALVGHDVGIGLEDALHKILPDRVPGLLKNVCDDGILRSAARPLQTAAARAIHRIKSCCFA